ncbi:hypothetical protein RZN22_11765 [Bacillaceae bacterium S4-13-58]
MLEIIFWLIMLYIAAYTFSYARQINKDKNKIGAFSVGALALTIIGLLFFIKLK